MKSIKFIFAVLLVSVLFIACTSDNSTEDEILYGVEDVQSTGEDGSATVDRTRT